MATLSCSVMLGSQSGKGSSFSNLVIVLLKLWAAISYLGEAQLTPATSHTTLYFHLQWAEQAGKGSTARQGKQMPHCCREVKVQCSVFPLHPVFQTLFYQWDFSTRSKVGQNLEMSFQNVSQICQPYFSWLSSGAFPFVPNSDKPPPVPDYPSSPTFPY